MVSIIINILVESVKKKGQSIRFLGTTDAVDAIKAIIESAIGTSVLWVYCHVIVGVGPVFVRKHFYDEFIQCTVHIMCS